MRRQRLIRQWVNEPTHEGVMPRFWRISAMSIANVVCAWCGSIIRSTGKEGKTSHGICIPCRDTFFGDRKGNAGEAGTTQKKEDTESAGDAD